MMIVHNPHKQHNDMYARLIVKCTYRSDIKWSSVLCIVYGRLLKLTYTYIIEVKYIYFKVVLNAKNNNNNTHFVMYSITTPYRATHTHAQTSHRLILPFQLAIILYSL